MISNVDKNFVALCGYWECAGEPENPKWLKAYLDSGGVWTIGIGTIRYPNGKAVKKGDVITAQEKDEYFLHEVRAKVDKVNFFTRDDINQHQFNATVDLAYNIGTTALQKSSLLEMLNKDLNSHLLVDKFLQWRFDNGKMIPGLLRRRMSDAYHYFTGQLKYDWKNYRTFTAATVNEVKEAIKSNSNCY